MSLFRPLVTNSTVNSQPSTANLNLKLSHTIFIMRNPQHRRARSFDSKICSHDQNGLSTLVSRSINKNIQHSSHSAPIIMSRQPKQTDQGGRFRNSVTIHQAKEEKEQKRGPPWMKTPREVFELGGEPDSLGETEEGRELKDYLLYQGLNMGLASDIKLVINGTKTYTVHKFIMSQAPMFREAISQLGENFNPLNWDSVDAFVDLAAVDHIINRLYGNMGDKYYEAKNLIPIMGVCIQWGLITWFHSYLDRFMSRLSAETLPAIVDFALDDFYGDWVEPHVLPVIKHYMARYGVHLGIKAWRILPVDWIVEILNYDGFIYTDFQADDVKKELGYCKVVIGHEYERWVFARNVYYDRLGIDSKALRHLEENRVLPSHITPEVIEEQYPLFEFLNSSKTKYCNMSPFNWKQIRKETLFGTNTLVNPKILADAIFKAVRLRRCVEDADLDDTKLHLTFSFNMDSPEGCKYEVPNVDRFIFRPRRVELRNDPTPLPQTGENGLPAPGDIDIPHLTTIPPIRFSVEFQFHRGIGAMSSSAPLRSEPVFYGGSWWQFSIRKTKDEAEPAERINMYLRRVGKPIPVPASATSEGSSAAFPDIDYDELTREHLETTFDPETLDKLLEGESTKEFYDDKRQNAAAYFRIFAPSFVAGYDPEKFIIISGKEFPKMRAPAVSRTTIFEGKLMVFPLDTDIMVPGRMLMHEVEEAEELKDFINDSPYFKGVCDDILNGGVIKLPKQRESYLTTVYQRTGEVFGDWEKEGKAGPDKKVTSALKERDIAYANMKFGIVIGLV